MKRTSAIQHWTSRLAAGALAVGVALCVLNARADSPKPEQLREEARNLERKSQELKAEGRHEEAKEVWREVQEIRTKADQMEQQHGQPDAANRMPPPELEQKRRELLAELKELHQAGNEDRAVEVRKQVQRIEMELSRAAGRPEGEPNPQPPPQRAEAERRVRHLREAVRNLHAAGMNDAAEAIAQQAEHLEQRLQSGPGMNPRGPMVPRPELDRMRAEMEELRQTVRHLQERVEDLARGSR
jgi:hypothetical protein